MNAPSIAIAEALQRVRTARANFTAYKRAAQGALAVGDIGRADGFTRQANTYAAKLIGAEYALRALQTRAA